MGALRRRSASHPPTCAPTRLRCLRAACAVLLITSSHAETMVSYDDDRGALVTYDEEGAEQRRRHTSYLRRSTELKLEAGEEASPRHDRDAAAAMRAERARRAAAAAAMRPELGGQKLKELWKRSKDGGVPPQELMNHVKTVCKGMRGVGGEPFHFSKAEFDRAVRCPPPALPAAARRRRCCRGVLPPPSTSAARPGRISGKHCIAFLCGVAAGQLSTCSCGQSIGPLVVIWRP